MKGIGSEPFLWIHLSGIAVVPLGLEAVWLGLSVGQPLSPFWLELLLLVGVGVIPVLWMQWNRPFDIFSLLLVSLKPNRLTPNQQKILSLFKTTKHRLLSAIAAVLMVCVLWQLYQLAPLAAIAASPLPQSRLLGLLLAGIALLVSNLFLQVPVSVIGILLTSEQQFAGTAPSLPTEVPQQFTVPGVWVDRILSLTRTS
jgi:hypothetical protein